MLLAKAHETRARLVLDAIHDRLQQRPEALTALETAVSLCYEDGRADCPLDELLITWPALGVNGQPEVYNGTDILMAALDTGLLDSTANYHLCLALLNRLVQAGQHAKAARLASHDSLAAVRLTKSDFLDFKYAVAVALLMEADGRAEAESLIEDWPQHLAINARNEAARRSGRPLTKQRHLRLVQ